jgi:hypothetical protein
MILREKEKRIESQSGDMVEGIRLAYQTLRRLITVGK